MNSDFGAARVIIAVMQVVGWIMIGGGLLVGVMLLAETGDALTMLVVAQIMGGGLLLIAAAQVIKALIITAENTGQLVTLARAAADRPDRPERGTRPAVHSISAPPEDAASRQSGPLHERNQVGTLVKRYRGHEIVREPNGFSVDGDVEVPSVGAAERHIDSLGGEDDGRASGALVRSYRGRSILRREIGFSVDGIGSFPTIDEAIEFIDRNR